MNNLVRDKINSFKQIKPTGKGLFQTSTGFIIDALKGGYFDKKIIIYLQNEDNTKVEVFKNVDFINNGNVEDTKKYTEHPIESGEVVSDYFISNPIVFTTTMVLDIEDNENRLLLIDYYKNGTFLSIKVGGEYFNNLVISQKPYEIRNDSVNKYYYNLTFKQILIANTRFLKLPLKKVVNGADATTVNTGNIQAKKSSILSKMLKGSQWK